MDAAKYYDLLINGYVREIERKLNVKWIPNEIKELCISYYYIFLMHNKYCDVQIKHELDATKLLIQTRINNGDEKTVKFGGRLVSRIPINTNDNLSKSKVTISIKTDELDLIEGDEYTQ